jgi:hypothetical protein
VTGGQLLVKAKTGMAADLATAGEIPISRRLSETANFSQETHH